MDTDAFLHKSLESPRRFLVFALLAYTLLIVYGSLYPFTGWQLADPLGSLRLGWPQYWSRADTLTNLLIYAPLGLFCGRLLLKRRGRWSSLFIAASMAAGLSTLLELLQGLLPERDPSLLDILLNTVGAAIGAAAGLIYTADSAAHAAVVRFIERWFRAAPYRNIGLMVVGLWILGQLFPFVPGLDMGTLREGVRPLLRVVDQPGEFEFAKCLALGLNLFALGLLGRTLLHPQRRALVTFVVFAGSVLLLKVVVIKQAITAEAAVGLVLAAAALWLTRQYVTDYVRLGIGALVCAYVVDAVAGGSVSSTGGFNWMPLRTQMEHFMGIAEVLTGLWPSAAVGYFFVLLHERPPGRATMMAGGVGMFAFGLVVEGMQGLFDGKVGDVTQPLFLWGGWMIAWFGVPLERVRRKRVAVG